MNGNADQVMRWLERKQFDEVYEREVMRLFQILTESDPLHALPPPAPEPAGAGG